MRKRKMGLKALATNCILGASGDIARTVEERWGWLGMGFSRFCLAKLIL
jgi:hypothetical protein